MSAKRSKESRRAAVSSLPPRVGLAALEVDVASAWPLASRAMAPPHTTFECRLGWEGVDASARALAGVDNGFDSEHRSD